MDFGQPNVEIGQKIFNGQLLFLALQMYFRVHFVITFTTIYYFSLWIRLPYSGKVWQGEFGESSVIHQTQTIQFSTYNYNLLAESIHSPSFFSSNAPNKYVYQTFPLYGMYKYTIKSKQTRIFKNTKFKKTK